MTSPVLATSPLSLSVTPILLHFASILRMLASSLPYQGQRKTAKVENRDQRDETKEGPFWKRPSIKALHQGPSFFIRVLEEQTARGARRDSSTIIRSRHSFLLFSHGVEGF